jgi:hypothetical protein
VSDPVLSQRGRLNALRRWRHADDPAIATAERDLAAESIAEHAHRIVADWPALTDEQIDRVAAILRGASS